MTSMHEGYPGLSELMARGVAALAPFDAEPFAGEGEFPPLAPRAPIPMWSKSRRIGNPPTFSASVGAAAPAPKRAVLLVGEDGTGKSSLARGLLAGFEAAGVTARVDGFAVPLKRALEAMLAGTRWVHNGEEVSLHDALYGRSELRSATSPDVWGTLREHCLIESKHRDVDPAFYVKLGLARAPAGSVTVFEDTRFINEIDDVRRAFGAGSTFVVRCTRDGRTGATPPEQDALHLSLTDARFNTLVHFSDVGHSEACGRAIALADVPWGVQLWQRRTAKSATNTPPSGR
jgi:hypothetical protein